MRAVRCENGAAKLVDVPAPQHEGVRVRIHSAGICGSDLHLVSSDFAPSVTLGHEMAGELADGTAVAIEPLVPCRVCDPCERDDYNLCRVGPAAVFGVGRDGGMADEIVVPERCLVPLSPDVELADASLIEPLAVAVHGIRRVGIGAGSKVAVVGGGTIGLCALVAARAAGAQVALVARHDAQRAAGERLGALRVHGEYDVVVDSAGTGSALEQAVELARPGGTLLLLGTYWNGMSMPGIALCMKEIRVVPSSMYSRVGKVRDFEVAAGLLAARPEMADALITHRFSLDEAVRGFATAADRAGGAIKVVLEV